MLDPSSSTSLASVGVLTPLSSTPHTASASVSSSSATTAAAAAVTNTRSSHSSRNRKPDTTKTNTTGTHTSRSYTRQPHEPHELRISSAHTHGFYIDIGLRLLLTHPQLIVRGAGGSSIQLAIEVSQTLVTLGFVMIERLTTHSLPTIGTPKSEIRFLLKRIKLPTRPKDNRNNNNNNQDHQDQEDGHTQQEKDLIELVERERPPNDYNATQQDEGEDDIDLM